jgi:RimJ/RimL family protein N-acetyltransferase
MTEVYNNIAASPQECLYAILDKANRPNEDKTDSNYRYAGVVSLSGTNPINAVTEMGIIVFPAFQRTHVATNAVGLLLQRTLDPPSAGGLGLRRVEWKTHADNAASRRIALRMGFVFEGIASGSASFRPARPAAGSMRSRWKRWKGEMARREKSPEGTRPRFRSSGMNGMRSE